MVEGMDHPSSLCGRGHSWPCTLGAKHVTHLVGPGYCRRRLIGNTVWGPHATGTVLRSNCWRNTTDPCFSVVLLGGERGVSCLVLPPDRLLAPLPVPRLPVVRAHKKGGKAALCLLSPWRTDSQELDTVADRCICSTTSLVGRLCASYVRGG